MGSPPNGGVPKLPLPGQPAPLQPGEYVAGSVANQVTFGFDKIGPPSALYVQRDDVLRLDAATNNPAGETVTFLVRFLRVPEPTGGQPSDAKPGALTGAIYQRGIVTVEAIDVVISAGSTNVVSRNVQMAEGYLLSVTARPATTVNRGRTFARAHLVRFPGGAFLQSQLLFADYLTAAGAAGWPNGRYQSSVEGPGWVHSVQVANPGAGVEWSFTAGANQRIRIISANAVLTTNATVANRVPRIVIDDGANLLTNGVPNQIVPASTTANVTATTSQTGAAANVADVTCGLPGQAFLMPGFRLRSLTGNFQAADAYTAIWLNFEEWIEAI